MTIAVLPDLDAADLAFFSDAMHARYGIVLGDSKASMVARRIGQRVRILEMGSIAEYRQRLERQPDSAEWAHVVSALTTHETSFFREIHHFRQLADHLRDLAASRAQRIRLWSAACSSGEEAYSMAMTVLWALGAPAMDIRILATDIDEFRLGYARDGQYEREILERIPKFSRRFFDDLGDGWVRIVNEVRPLVSFKSHNLAGTYWPMSGPFNAIFCRNALIYFDRPTQAAVVSRLVDKLAPDGILCLGHAEVLPPGVVGMARTDTPSTFRKS